MTRLAQCGLLLCVALAAIALVWSTRDGKRLRKEIDPKGTVIIEGDGMSSFSEQYRATADLVAKGRLSEAESQYRELTNKEPNSPNAYVGLASCRVGRNDLPGARELYKTALRIDPKSINAFIGLGSTYSAESDYTNAAANYEAAVALNERSPEAHWGLAIAYAHLGKQAQARTNLDRFKKLAPDSRHIPALEEIVGRSYGQPDASPNAAPPHR